MLKGKKRGGGVRVPEINRHDVRRFKNVSRPSLEKCSHLNVNLKIIDVVKNLAARLSLTRCLTWGKGFGG
jgi:hypothetical protein